MTSKFLTTGSSDLVDGTANLYIASLAIDSLNPGLPIKTDGSNVLVSTLLDIADVDNLQNELDNVISNPLTSNLDFDGNDIVDMTSLEMVKQASQPASTAGTLRLYANTSGEIHQVDEAGVDTVVGGDTFNQDLNTTNDVEFKSVAVEGWDMTQDVPGDFQLSKGQNKLVFGDHTSGIPSTLCLFTSTNGGGAGGFRNFRSRGTLAAPTAVLINNVLDVRRTFAHDGTDYVDCAAVRTLAEANHTISNSSTYADICLTPAGSKAAIEYYEFRTTQFNVGRPGIGYTLPTTRGTLDQVLKTNGSGVVTWADDGHSFDQSLNTADNVNFNTLGTAGKITLGKSVPATEWQLPDIRGTNGQILYTTGSQAYWDDSVNEDVRYISSPLYGVTDITGLLSISPLAGGAIQNSDSANQGPNASVSPSSYGFTFTLTEDTQITSIGINGNHIGFAAGPRAFRIYRDSDQAVMLDSTIANTDPVDSGRYVKAVDVVLSADNYRVGVTLVTGDNRGISDQSATLNANLGAVRGCSGGADAYPSSLLGLGFAACGYIYFKQPPGVAACVSVQKVTTAEVDNIGGQLVVGLDSGGVELGKPGAQTLVRSTFRALQQTDINGGLSIGVTQGVNDYTMPLTRGDYCDVMKTDSVGNVVWARHGNYSKTDTTIVTNTLVKTNVVGVGVGSLVIPAWNLGDVYHCKVAGVVDSEGKSEDVTITLELDGVIIWSSDFVDVDDLKTDVDWEVECDVVVKSLGVAGDFYANGQFVYSKDNDSAGWRGLNAQYESNIDTTASHTLSVNAQWAAAKVGNIFTTKMLVVTKLF